MKKFILPLLAAGVAATPALAAPTITFNTSPAIPSYTTAKIFESFEGQTGASGTVFNPSQHAASDVSIGQTEATTGSRVYSGTTPGVAVDTDNNSSTKYLSVLGGTSYTVNFSTPVQFFSFIIGSLDTYNSVTLTYGTTTQTLMGADILGSAGSSVVFNSTGNSGTAGRVNYDFGGGAGLTSVVFSSTRDSLEIDDLAAAVPEAATWAMMMVGLGMVGGALRRRQTKVSVRYANA